MAVGLPPRYPNDVQSGKTTPSFPLSQNYVVTRLQWLFLVRYQVSVSGVLTWCGSGWQRLTDNSMKGGAWLVLVSRRLVTCLLHMAALNCCYQLRYRQQWWVATYARRWRTTYPLLRGLVIAKCCVLQTTPTGRQLVQFGRLELVQVVRFRLVNLQTLHVFFQHQPMMCSRS